MTVSRLREKKLLQNRCNTALPSPELRVLEEDLRAPKFPSSARVTNSPNGKQSSGNLERELLARGIRLTAQRRSVLSVLEDAPRCRNVGVIHRRARKLNSAVHRVTVYRTLALLKRYGMLSEGGDLKACAGAASCPRAAECEQIQMKCLHCGKIVGFKSCVVSDLMQCVERDCRFRVSRASVDIAGYCKNCRV